MTILLDDLKFFQFHDSVHLSTYLCLSKGLAFHELHITFVNSFHRVFLYVQ